jgi:predicted dienelactone hydrolase
MTGDLSKLIAKLLAPAAILFALAIVACGDGENASTTATPVASPIASPAASAITSATATLPATVPAQALAERGPFAVGVATLTLVDESRPTDANGSYAGADSRTLVTEVWYPAEGSVGELEIRDAPLDRSKAPYPLIVFSHGYTGIRRQSTTYTSHLASHGYVVVSPDYPLTNLAAPGGPRLSDVLNQPGDVSFLIDSFLGFSLQSGHQLEGAIDEEAIGLSGHSLGGLTTLLATFGSLRDPRIKAALPIAGPACLVGATAYDTSAVPLLVMGGSEDGVVAWHSVRAAYDMAKPPKYLLAILGANHLRFADLDAVDSTVGTLESTEGFLQEVTRVGQATGANLMSCVADGSADLPAAASPLTADRQRELMRLFATAFFDRYLKSDEAAASVLSPEFAAGVPEVRLEHKTGED